MGWSCRADAGATLDKWTAACVAQTGSQNTYTVDGVQYFFEVSRHEYDDGRITGQIFRMEANNMCRKVSSFRINPDGSVQQAPAFLKNASK
jgi:hypothetical protein